MNYNYPGGNTKHLRMNSNFLSDSLYFYLVSLCHALKNLASVYKVIETVGFWNFNLSSHVGRQEPSRRMRFLYLQ